MTPTYLRALQAAILSLFVSLASAQALTPQQLAAVCTAVKADPAANAARVAGDTVALRGWLDGAKTPTTLVWRADVTPQESDEAATYTSYDTLATGKRDSWALFLRYNRDFGRNKVRNWVVDVWGNASSNSVAEAVLQAGTKPGTNLQVTLGGTSRTTGTVTALDAAWKGSMPSAALDWLVNPGGCQ